MPRTAPKRTAAKTNGQLPTANEARGVEFRVPRGLDTKNYAKFNLENQNNGKPFGAFYVPLDEADGVLSLTVSFNYHRK
jgi:hypothetical protein